MKRTPKRSPGGSKKAAGAAGGLSERFVQTDGHTIRCTESGRGNPLVIIEGPGETAPSALANLLAHEFRVISLELPAPGDSSTTSESGLMRELARALDRAAAAAGLERYILVAGGANAPAALWQAVEGNERVEALVLIAPKGLVTEEPSTPHGADQDRELEHRLEEIKAPTLVLLGTNEDVVPREMARAYARRIPTSCVVLVYDAGESIQTERPEALLGTLRDFVEQREKFVVNLRSTAINP